MPVRALLTLATVPLSNGPASPPAPMDVSITPLPLPFGFTKTQHVIGAHAVAAAEAETYEQNANNKLWIIASAGQYNQSDDERGRNCPHWPLSVMPAA